MSPNTSPTLVAEKVFPAYSGFASLTSIDSHSLLYSFSTLGTSPDSWVWMGMASSRHLGMSSLSIPTFLALISLTTSESTWNLVGLEVHPKVILNSTNILPPHSTHCSGQSSTLTPRCLYAEAQSTLVNWASLPTLWSVSNTSFVSAMGHLRSQMQMTNTSNN